jgi:hypothetical protein
MTVKILRGVIRNFHDKVTTTSMNQFRARKAGFPVTGPNKSLVIYTILCRAVLDTNEPLQESDTARKPEWMDINTFNSLITKITLT